MNSNGEEPHNGRVAPKLDEPVAPLVRKEGPMATGERFRPYALAAITACMIALCIVLAVPFLPALTWGVALAIIAWPLHLWISRRISRESLAAAVTAFVVIVLILAPGLFVTYQLASEANRASEHMQEQTAGEAVRGRMAETPILSGVVAWMDRVNLDLDREIRKVVASFTSDVSGLIQGSLTAIFQFAIALFILFHLLKDRTPLMRELRALLPMTKPESEQVVARVTDSVYANLYATVVTSIIDAIGGGLMFWALGLPSPILWAVVMFVLSTLPLLGTWLVWAPAAAYLGLTGRWAEALILIGWGVVSGFVVDNIIYVRLAGDRMRLHQVPALIAFVGGLAVFGMTGMILGPAILAVTVALLEVWHSRTTAPDAPIARAEVRAELRAAH